MGSSRRKRRIAVGVSIAAFALIAYVAVSAQSPGKTVEDGVITARIGSANADERTSFTVTLREDNAEHESEHLFEALAGLPGLSTAALDARSSELEVAFDSSKVDRSAIRQRLLRAGYASPTAEDAAPVTLADDGKRQSIEIADSQGFAPAYIRAKAGLPLDLVFGPASECRTKVRLPDLGVEQDLTEGATVALPALEAGSYAIVCGSDGLEGMLFVE